jgi:hypothetical protein
LIRGLLLSDDPLRGLHGFHDRSETARVPFRDFNGGKLVNHRVLRAFLPLTAHVLLETSKFGIRQRRQLAAEERLEAAIHLVNAPTDAGVGCSK